MEWSVLDVSKMCDEIIEDVKLGKLEIYPGLQGKLMKKAYQFGPGLIEYSSKFLKAQKLSDFFK